MTWNGKYYVAVGMFGTIVSSTDGINWVTENSGTGVNLESIIWEGKKFVVVGNEGL